MTNFGPFGHIISATVSRDKATGLSKCFGALPTPSFLRIVLLTCAIGFVSYDNPASGRSAITAMNGFMASGKRIKVEERKEKPGEMTGTRGF